MEVTFWSISFCKFFCFQNELTQPSRGCRGHPHVVHEVAYTEPYMNIHITLNQSHQTTTFNQCLPNIKFP